MITAQSGDAVYLSAGTHNISSLLIQANITSIYGAGIAFTNLSCYDNQHGVLLNSTGENYFPEIDFWFLLYYAGVAFVNVTISNCFTDYAIKALVSYSMSSMR